MQKLFDEVSSLDKRCYEKYALSEDVLMEHAANGMAQYICSKCEVESKVLIICGSGNNGADGMALARLLHLNFDVWVYLAKTPTSKMALLQLQRMRSIGVRESATVIPCDVVVDAYVGSGFRGNFDKNTEELMKKLNALNALKIACDVPSGLKINAIPIKNTFLADVTLTMGALKKFLFLDAAKDYVGDIKLINLGLPREVYEKSSNWKLLDKEDMKLPFRNKKDSHKGNFGHLGVILGEKKGAGIMSAKTALRFGTGLVTLIGFSDDAIPDSLMSSQILPSNTTALALGMGLGDIFSKKELSAFLDNKLALVADADIFYMPEILEILKREKLVLTPHPKEFVALLNLTKIAKISVDTLQENRFKYTEIFCQKYPKVTLLLKGANVVIGKKNRFFINAHGTSVLAKAGSGDVLSGLIGALLAQGHECLDAAICASLAHTSLAQNYAGANFSLTAEDLIAGIGNL